MVPKKFHFPYSELETVCGIDLAKTKVLLTDKKEEITCGRCYKIVLIFRSDSHNRPKKNIAKKPLSTSNIKDGNNI